MKKNKVEDTSEEEKVEGPQTETAPEENNPVESETAPEAAEDGLDDKER